ncbi:MAG: hypothetical protein H6816_05280 [Phycisphaerales bacterium]|nr:hypothetical protein [Phycisphaerales bacterium]
MASRILFTIAVASFAATTHAATVSIQWLTDTASQTITTPPNSTVTAQVSLDLIAGESTAGLISWFTDTTPDLEIGQQRTSVPGWQTGQYPGDLAVAQLAFAADVPLETNLNGPLSLVLGEFDIIVSGSPGTTLPLALDASGSPLGLIDEVGQSYTWDARYNTTVPGYVAYGDFGNPGWGHNISSGHQPDPNPLFVTVSPEPASALLLACGALALMRRR